MHFHLNPPAAPTIDDTAIIKRVDFPVPSNYYNGCPAKSMLQNPAKNTICQTEDISIY